MGGPLPQFVAQVVLKKKDTHKGYPYDRLSLPQL